MFCSIPTKSFVTHKETFPREGSLIIFRSKSHRIISFQSTCNCLQQHSLITFMSSALGYPVIHNCDGCTATVAKCAHMASAEARFTTSTKISIRAVPRSKVLNGYKGKHTLGRDDTYRHFRNMVYTIANSAIIIKIVVTHALILATNLCWPSAPLSPQSGGNVGGLNLKPSGYAGGSVNALAEVDGFTNLYSSITADPRIILSTILDRKIVIAIRAISAIKPIMEDTNSSFRHPSAFLINFLNSFWAFQYCISL